MPTEDLSEEGARSSPLRLFALCTLLLFMVSACAVACAREDTTLDKEQTPLDTKSIEQVLAERTPEWMSIRGVVGTSIGECDGEPCIRVMVEKKTPTLERRIPPTVSGYTVDIVETGEFRALGR